jgi:peptidoglycan/xylan/chitin deacetylase (PgdA/CDA1 family)
MLRLNSLKNRNQNFRWNLLATIRAGAGRNVCAAGGVPVNVVVLKFDDKVRSQFEVVGPLLKQYGFGVTFFITEGFEFQKYMTREISSVHAVGRGFMRKLKSTKPRLR